MWIYPTDTTIPCAPAPARPSRAEARRRGGRFSRVAHLLRYDPTMHPRGWLFGLVRVRREMGGQKPTAPETLKKRKKSRGVGIPSLTVIRRGIGLLGELLDRVRIRRAKLDLSVGTDDPAATGELAGFAAPIVALANALPRTRVTFTPDFTGPTLEGAGEGEIRVVPISLVRPMVGFALSPEVRRWLLTRR